MIAKKKFEKNSSTKWNINILEGGLDVIRIL